MFLNSDSDRVNLQHGDIKSKEGPPAWPAGEAPSKENYLFISAAFFLSLKEMEMQQPLPIQIFSLDKTDGNFKQTPAKEAGFSFKHPSL